MEQSKNRNKEMACDPASPNDHRSIDAVMEKLSYYEELEKKGRLLMLPCAVGDTVFRICKRDLPCRFGTVLSLNCEYGCPYDNFSYDSCDCRSEWFVKPETMYRLLDVILIRGAIGETVFLTEDDAWDAIKRKGDSE